VREGLRGRARMRSERWPLRWAAQNASARVDGSLAVNWHEADRVEGNFDLSTELHRAGQSLGVLKFSGGGDLEKVDVELKSSQWMGGAVEGRAVWMPRQWTQSTGALTWNGVDLSVFRDWAQRMPELQGVLRGRVAFGPADTPRAPEPWQVKVRVEPEGSDGKVRVRRVPVGPLEATLLIGPKRALVHELKLGLAGGQAELWASLHRHDGVWYDHFSGSCRGLDLNQLHRAFPDTAEGDSVPGVLSGRFQAFGRLGAWQAHTGDGVFRLREANLIETDIMGRVLRLLGAPAHEAHGVGSIEFRLEKSTMSLDRFVYRHDPAEILLTMRINDLRQGMASPIQGAAIGSLRPLKNVLLPGFEDLDRMLRALQANVTSVQIDGTLKEPAVEQTTALEIQAFLRRLFEYRP